MNKRSMMVVAIPFMLSMSSCSKEQIQEIHVDSQHLLDHALDLTITGDSNSIQDYIHFAGDIAETIGDVIDEDTEPALAKKKGNYSGEVA